MRLTLGRLLRHSFHEDDAARGNVAIEEVRERLEGSTHQHATAYEVVVPDHLDASWFTQLLHGLVHYCEGMGAHLPGCSGVFVACFRDDRLYCIHAADVVRFGCDELHITPAELVELSSLAVHDREKTQALRPD